MPAIISLGAIELAVMAWSPT